MAGSQNLNHEGTKIKEEEKSAGVHVSCHISFGHDRPIVLLDKLGKFCPICNIIKKSIISDYKKPLEKSLISTQYNIIHLMYNPNIKNNFLLEF